MSKNLYEDTLAIEQHIEQLKGHLALFERMIELGWKESDVLLAYGDVNRACVEILSKVKYLQQNAVDKFNTYHVEKDIIAQYGV